MRGRNGRKWFFSYEGKQRVYSQGEHPIWDAQAGHSRNKQQTNPQRVSFFMPEVLLVAKSRCFAMQKPPRQRAKPLSRGLIRVWISAKPEEAVQNSGREPKAHRKQKSAAKPTVRRVISCRLRPREPQKNRPPKTRPGARTRPRQRHKRQKNRKRAELVKPKRQKKKGAGQNAAKRPEG